MFELSFLKVTYLSLVNQDSFHDFLLCIDYGHWTYECKQEKTYVQRTSRTKILNRKSNEISVSTHEHVLEEENDSDETNYFKMKKEGGVANKILKDKKRLKDEKPKRKHSVSSSSSSSSSSSGSSSSGSSSDSSSSGSSSSSSGSSDSSTDSEKRQRKKSKQKK